MTITLKISKNGKIISTTRVIILGGKVPGNLLNSGRPKMIGFLLIGIGLIMMIPFVLGIINEFKSDETLLPTEYVLRFIQILGFGAFSSVMMQD
jgi:hypothetical protein